MRITFTDPACGLQFARRICGLYDYVPYRGRPKMPRLKYSVQETIMFACVYASREVIVSRSTLMLL